MKINELKKILKPLIKECIKEVIFESGVLSKVVTEVAHGMSVAQNGQQVVSEQQQSPVEREEVRREKLREVNEQRRQLRDSIGSDAYNGINVFEGTDPLDSGGTPDAPSSGSGHGPLAGRNPSDAGVDLGSLMGGGRSAAWKILANGKG